MRTLGLFCQIACLNYELPSSIYRTEMPSLKFEQSSPQSLAELAWPPRKRWWYLPDALVDGHDQTPRKGTPGQEETRGTDHEHAIEKRPFGGDRSGCGRKRGYWWRKTKKVDADAYFMADYTAYAYSRRFSRLWDSSVRHLLLEIPQTFLGNLN